MFSTDTPRFPPDPVFFTRKRVFQFKLLVFHTPGLRTPGVRPLVFHPPIQFRLLLDQSINVFMSICLKKPYFLTLQEVFKDWQKFMMKQSESFHTSFLSVPIESLAEMKPEIQKSYLEWLDQRFKSKAFSDALLSKMLSTS